MTSFPHEISPQILQCEYIIDYIFRNKSHADEALRSLCRADTDVIRVHWNISLAALGKTIMSSLMCKMWWIMNPQRQISDWKMIKKELLSKSALAERGRRLGLVRAMQLVLRDQVDDQDKLLATAIRAIVGAVYVDAGGEEAVDHVLRALGLYNHALLGERE
ncbi:hypothetical protein EJ04DRAFT_556209 [Polyplosphaeria fusca]|uniref:RNase III domain-containing protein n=1 Tax=Polyplosphaeria fusca TaxID=682080 RepID=A0A9P4UWG4_9PLEO|nr:hypothetical protein EJ04DRAFT_556209 [Polyplosphaeria fusca]